MTERMPCPAFNRAYPGPTVIAQIDQPMPYNLSDYRELVENAVADYWNVRHAQAAKSRGQGVILVLALTFIHYTFVRAALELAAS